VRYKATPFSMLKVLRWGVVRWFSGDTMAEVAPDPVFKVITVESLCPCLCPSMSVFMPVSLFLFVFLFVFVFIFMLVFMFMHFRLFTLSYGTNKNPQNTSRS
jgi:hypothetical protein